MENNTLDSAQWHLNIRQVSTGFVEIPNNISLNIYVQGCEKNCIGCQNPELQSFTGGVKIDLKEMDLILNDYPLCKWICWLGGDAVYQPEAFQLFNKEFKRRKLDVALYTGCYLDEIRHLVSDVDLIIDGPWEGIPVTEKNSNQKIWLQRFCDDWFHIETWNSLKNELNKRGTK